jgi:hypothetical protein
MLIFSGCATRPPQPAVVGPETIQNTTVGFNGYIFRIPPELKFADFLESAPHGTVNEQMLGRVFQSEWRNINRDSEWCKNRFSEAFLFSDPDGKTGFLFAVQLLDIYSPMPPFCHLLSPEKRMIYNEVCRTWNIQELQPVMVGERQALCSYGTAFEKDGHIYKTNGPGRLPVAYACCFILGDTRDFYTIIGCAEPKDAGALKLNLQRMMDGLSFP